MRQDYADFEVLAVNDASKDRSLEICQKYADDDNRIKVIDLPENGGVENARYRGLEAAKGEFVFFMDADDWLSNRRVFSIMVSIAAQTGADYVEMAQQRVLDKFSIIKKKPHKLRREILSGKDLEEKYISFFGRSLLSTSMCCKLYRKRTIDKMEYEPAGVSFGEDLYFNMKLFPHIEKIVLTDSVGYNYRIGGSTGAYQPNLLTDSKKLFLLKQKEIDLRLSHDEKNYALYSRHIRKELAGILKTHIMQRIEYLKETEEEITHWLTHEMEDPVYQSLTSIYKVKKSRLASFLQALSERNYQQIYEISKGHVDKTIASHRLKKILFKLLG